MKLIYCTSLAPPFSPSNKLQMLSMAKAFTNKLKANFYFGISKVNKDLEFPFSPFIDRLDETQIFEFGKHKSYWLAFKYFKFIRKNKIPFVYCRESRLLFFLMLFHNFLPFLRTKFIYEVHLIPEKGFLDKVIERFCAKPVDYFVFVTKHLRDLYLERYKLSSNRALVAPDGVDLEVFDLDFTTAQARERLDLPLNKKIIGFTGRFKTLNMDKGLETVLEALRLLEEDILFLAMGGKPRHIQEYLEKAQVLGVSHKVIFIEHLNQAAVALRQKACDILLMPFPRNQHYAFYMSPAKMFEYMASKRPIVASDLPSVREVLNERNAFFVRPDEPADLARVIKKVLENKDLAQRISQQAYLDVQNYTWQKRVEKIIDFIIIGTGCG